MSDPRPTSLRLLAERHLEQVELLEAPAARIAANSSAENAHRIAWLRRRLAMMRATLAQSDAVTFPLLVQEDRGSGPAAKEPEVWSRGPLSA